MEKIVFVSNPSKPADEIFNSLSRKYETKMIEFNNGFLLKEISDFSPALILIYSKNFSHMEICAFNSIVSDSELKKIPILFIGNKNDRTSYITPLNGNVAGTVQTPTTVSAIIDKTDLIIASIHQKDDETKNQDDEETPKDERKHILVVDDDPVTLRIMMNILKDNYKTTVAKSGTAAISLLGTQKPDLILLDYLMPVCNGIQTLQMIRSEENTKDIPVFFLTGVSTVEDVKNAMALKPEGYILKTTEPAEILRRIGEFFEKVQ